MGNDRRYVIIGSRGYPSTYGGFETLVRRLAPYLARCGDDVTVYGRRGVPTEPESPHERIKVVRTPGIERRSLSTLTHGLTSSLHAAAGRPDAALVLNVANGFFLPALRSRGVPTAVNVDGIEWERDKWSTAGKAVFRSGARMTAKHASVLIADSQAIARYWHESFGRMSQFIPYGADIVPPSPPRHLHQVGVGGAEPYVLAVARLVPENNVDLLLDAMELLEWRHPVVVVGSAVGASPLEQRLRTLQSQVPNLTWLGHVADQSLLTELWQNCGVYVHGHSVGGTNPALLQALGAGSPTLVFSTPYNREVVGQDWPSYRSAPEHLAGLIDDLMSDSERRRHLSTSGRKIVADRYSWPDVLHSYRELLRSM